MLFCVCEGYVNLNNSNTRDKAIGKKTKTTLLKGDKEDIITL